MKYGFTLIELLICIAIFVVITSIAVWNNNAFNSSILLTDLAYEVALSVRQAQVFGITVKAPSSCTTSGCPSGFTSGYGVDFNTLGTVSMSSSTNYVLFEDVGPNPTHIYNQSRGDADIDNFAIGRGYSIRQLCVPGFSSHINTLDVSFIRPEPEAFVSVNGTAAVPEEADIFVQDPTDKFQREIVIEPTGQISVEDASASCI
jgi:prepilin-type N-terminal cleavage/methylation domain-containing protein